MSSNQKLVELFLSDKYRKEKQDLAHMVSDSFVFSGLRAGELDFDGYVKYAKEYFTEDRVTIDWVDTQDDENFVVGYTVYFSDNKNKKLIGNLAVSIENGLITRVIE